jgi:RNA polymerase sigma-70 factor (family 1)
MKVFSEYTDGELLSLIQGGEQAAFTEIYNRYWEKMANYAIRLTKSEDEAADIVQEIFVSLWRRNTELEVKGTLISYLIKATRNLSLRYMEKNIARNSFLERLSIQQRNGVSEIVEGIIVKELQLDIDRAVATLPAKMQQIYLLSRNEQRSYREIAQLLGIAEGTVKKQISNALKIISSKVPHQASGLTCIILSHLLHH